MESVYWNVSNNYLETLMTGNKLSNNISLTNQLKIYKVLETPLVKRILRLYNQNEKKKKKFISCLLFQPYSKDFFSIKRRDLH